MRTLMVCVLLLAGSCGQEARLVGPAMVGQVEPAPEVN